MKKSKFITEFKDIPTPREKMPHIPLEERKQNFREVELGFDEATALREAKRCLSCRRCIGCGLCLAECDPKAVVYDQKGTTIRLRVNSVILTPGFDEFDAGRISELGYRKYPNVITSIELERMLAPTGPYGGYVLRPYDGRVPERIAFVQCVGSRNEAIGADFCSSICCMTAMKEALALAGLIADSKVTILHRDIRPLGKGSEEFYQSVLKEKRVSFMRGPVAKITEIPETRNLVVELAEDGGGQAAASPGSGAQPHEFDLVVLSVGVRAAGKALSRKAGVRLNKYSFCTTDALNPGVTSKAGILSAGSFTAPMDIQSSVCHADAAAAVALRSLWQTAQAGQVAGASTGAGHSAGPVASPGPELPAGAGSSSGATGSTATAPVLVVGSGLAGLVAANELARAGHNATVIEKKKDTGGALSRYEFELDEKAEKDVVGGLLDAAKANSKIRILTSTELAKLSGEAGKFSVELKTDGTSGAAGSSSGGAESPETFGAVVVCSGGKEHVPDGLMYGENSRVMTQLEFGEALASGELAKALGDSGAGAAAQSGATGTGGSAVTGATGRATAAGITAAAGTFGPGEVKSGAAPSVVMVQCVGSRSSDWPVCSRVCCAQALRNALAVRKARPDAKVTIVHRDIRVYGLEEELLTEALEKGIEFVRLKDAAALV
ncbi:MAG: FAD-dependent oxidoreductase, partial [Candidatus Eisenbacteria bacterium]|nr:FAD-dependent oxidoreductase [Candidatus Eisenbacteria bacterium]